MVNRKSVNVNLSNFPIGVDRLDSIFMRFLLHFRFKQKQFVIKFIFGIEARVQTNGIMAFKSV